MSYSEKIYTVISVRDDEYVKDDYPFSSFPIFLNDETRITVSIINGHQRPKTVKEQELTDDLINIPILFETYQIQRKDIMYQALESPNGVYIVINCGIERAKQLLPALIHFAKKEKYNNSDDQNYSDVWFPYEESNRI